MTELRQEAQHAGAHRRHVRALIRSHPGLQQTLDAAIGAYDQLTETTSLRHRLAYVADLEAAFTPFFTMLLDHEAALFRPGDDRVASLFVWHFVEEIEHRSSALLIYDAVVGDKWYRMRALPRIVRHLMHVVLLITNGINEHVPPAERAIDTSTIIPLYRLVHRTRKDPDMPGVRPALHPVPWRQKLLTARRVLGSQTPMHNPAHAVIPAFADDWIARYDRGDDVSHGYTS